MQTKALLIERLRQIMEALNITLIGTESPESIIGRYDRHKYGYHTYQHIYNMLMVSQKSWEAGPFDGLNHDLFDLAIILHDIVYEPGSTMNELDSSFMVNFFTGLSPEDSEFVKNLILATDYSEPCDDELGYSIRVIDLMDLMNHQATLINAYKLKEESIWPTPIYWENTYKWAAEFIGKLGRYEILPISCQSNIDLMIDSLVNLRKYIRETFDVPREIGAAS